MDRKKGPVTWPVHSPIFFPIFACGGHVKLLVCDTPVPYYDDLLAESLLPLMSSERHQWWYSVRDKTCCDAVMPASMLGAAILNNYCKTWSSYSVIYAVVNKNSTRNSIFASIHFTPIPFDQDILGYFRPSLWSHKLWLIITKQHCIVT